jgi:hypothetical protein
MHGYKVFNPDFTCNGFQFGIGTFEHYGTVKLCKSGFHFCLKAVDCFTYYAFNPDNIVCEVEVEDVSEETLDDSKRVCRKLTVVKRLSWQEVLELVNTGKVNTGLGNSGWYNSGDNNSGDNNSGYYNSGNDNSGNYNSGDNNSGWYNSGDNNSGSYNSGGNNSGHYNSGNYNSGLFNIDEPKLRIFGQYTDVTMSELITQGRMPYITLQLAVDGKPVEYKQAWQNWWSTASDISKQKILDLPNFDAMIFEEITGVQV